MDDPRVSRYVHGSGDVLHIYRGNVDMSLRAAFLGVAARASSNGLWLNSGWRGDYPLPNASRRRGALCSAGTYRQRCSFWHRAPHTR